MTRFNLLSTIVSVALSAPSTIHVTSAAPHTPDRVINTNNGKNGEGVSGVVDVDAKNPNEKNGDDAPKNNAVLCSRELNAYCPSNTKCCPRYGSKQTRLLDTINNNNSIVGYSCLVNWSSRFPIGACCNDNDEDEDEDNNDETSNGGGELKLGSGCAAGYKCMPASTASSTIDAATSSAASASEPNTQLVTNEPHCQLDPTSHPIDNRGRPIENDYEFMPRYTTCPAFIANGKYEGDDDDGGGSMIGLPYGLPIPMEAATATGDDLLMSLQDQEENKNKLYMGQLAYYTNMGPLITTPTPASSTKDTSSPSEEEAANTSNSNPHQHVHTAIIGIHGSGRDAGSYLCALMGAVAKHTAADATTADDDADAGEDLNKSTNIGKDLNPMPKDASDDVTMSRNLHGNQRSRLRRNIGGEDKESSSGGKGEKGDTMNDEGEKDNVLVIAPWFLAPGDGQPKANDSPSTSSSTSELHTDLPFLQWVDDAPISHTFRYGAESIGIPLNNNGNKDGDELRSDHDGDVDDSARYYATISSYGAMDVLLETLCNKQNYPKLQKIVVAGHSAGGQFVHRWGLTSNSWCFGDSVGDDDDDSSSGVHGDGTKGGSNALREEESLPSIRLLPANPRSYAYLNGRRYLPKNNYHASSTKEADDNSMPLVEGQDKAGESSSATATLTPFDQLEYRVPNESEMNDCTEYNQYCWGLQDNPNLPTPYVSNNIRHLAHSTSQLQASTAASPLLAEEKDDQAQNIVDISTVLFTRYATRNVIYLSGERDTKQLGNQICHEDGYQGPSRRERSERFYQSLQVMGEEVWNMMCLGGDDSGDDTLARDGYETKEEERTSVEEEEGRSHEATKQFCSRERNNHDDGNSAEDEKYEMKVHDRSVVKNVGHDHALIFQSEEGREKIFG